MKNEIKSNFNVVWWECSAGMQSLKIDLFVEIITKRKRYLVNEKREERKKEKTEMCTKIKLGK